MGTAWSGHEKPTEGLKAATPPPPGDDTVVDLPSVTDPAPPIPKGVPHWHGDATGTWWAMVPGQHGPRLVEAPTADALAVTVDWHLRRAAW